MTLSERWLASEQRHAMSYERWLEYVAQDAEAQLETARKALEHYSTGRYHGLVAREALAQIGAEQVKK